MAGTNWKVGRRVTREFILDMFLQIILTSKKRSGLGRQIYEFMAYIWMKTMRLDEGPLGVNVDKRRGLMTEPGGSPTSRGLQDKKKAPEKNEV